MIPIPPGLAKLPIDMLVKVGIGLAFALCFFLIGMGAHKVFADRKIARMERDYAQQQAILNDEKAKAIQHARDTEARWRNDSVRMEGAYFTAIVQRDRIVRDLAVAGDGLRIQIKRLTSDSAAAAASSPACRDVHQRVETIGVLLAERDGMAEESERVADTLRDELSLCRAYAQSVSKQD